MFPLPCHTVFICSLVSFNSRPWNSWGAWLVPSFLYPQHLEEFLAHIRFSGNAENTVKLSFNPGDVDFMALRGKFYFPEKELFCPFCLIERLYILSSLRATYWVLKYMRIIIIIIMITIIIIIMVVAPTVYWVLTVCQACAKHLIYRNISINPGEYYYCHFADGETNRLRYLPHVTLIITGGKSRLTHFSASNAYF